MNAVDASSVKSMLQGPRTVPLLPNRLPCEDNLTLGRFCAIQNMTDPAPLRGLLAGPRSPEVVKPEAIRPEPGTFWRSRGQELR